MNDFGESPELRDPDRLMRTGNSSRWIGELSSLLPPESCMSAAMGFGGKGDRLCTKESAPVDRG